MASNKTLNAKNLTALGAARLAELLVEMSTGNAAVKRRLRLELAGAQSPGEVAKQVRKRLTTIARSQSFIDWQNRKELIGDLETQRRAIVDQVAKSDLAEALELLWRFTALANSVFERCDDSSGTVIGIFRAACRDLGEIAQTTKLAPVGSAVSAGRSIVSSSSLRLLPMRRMTLALMAVTQSRIAEFNSASEKKRRLRSRASTNL